jgi:hypothetical protein
MLKKLKDKNIEKINHYRTIGLYLLIIGISMVVSGAWLSIEKIAENSTILTYTLLFTIISGQAILLIGLWSFLILTLIYYEKK